METKRSFFNLKFNILIAAITAVLGLLVVACSPPVGGPGGPRVRVEDNNGTNNGDANNGANNGGVDECDADSDCGDNEVCFNSTCVDECVEDADCGAGMTCDDGACMDDGAGNNGDLDECARHSDCEAGELCVNDMCVEDTDLDECARHSDCGSGMLCVDGECVASQDDDCNDDADCGANEVCFNGTCIDECVEHSDCGSGMLCVDGECVEDSNGAECARHSDCESGEACINGMCVEDGSLDDCNDDTDCGAHEVCFNGTCIAECVIDTDCGTGEVCDDGACVTDQDEDCISNDQCPTGHECNVFTGMCVPDGAGDGGDGFGVIGLDPQEANLLIGTRFPNGLSFDEACFSFEIIPTSNCGGIGDYWQEKYECVSNRAGILFYAYHSSACKARWSVELCDEDGLQSVCENWLCEGFEQPLLQSEEVWSEYKGEIFEAGPIPFSWTNEHGQIERGCSAFVDYR